MTSPTPMPDGSLPQTQPGGALFALTSSGTPASESASALASTVVPTAYCRGPWSLETLHGGPVVGLLGWACEQVAPPSLLCSRLTVEMLRAVPLAELSVTARLVKPGRRTVVVDATIGHQGDLVARASSMWLTNQTPESPSQIGLAGPPPRPTEPAQPREQTDFDYPLPGFNCDTSELRYVSGSHEQEGPGTTWLRLLSPLIEGRPNSPFVMAATIADLAAAAGWERAPDGGNYINPDVTLQLHRAPIGPWLALDAQAEQTGNGVALMSAIVFDDHGPVGRILQSLVVNPVQLDAQALR